MNWLARLVTPHEDGRVYQDAAQRPVRGPLEFKSTQLRDRAYCRCTMNVFISYSHADEEWADELREQLPRVGTDKILVWDPAAEISPGENWALKQGRALEQADAVVVLLSPDSVKSESVRHEIEYVLSSPKFRDRLIPVMVKPTKEVPWFLRTLSLIDATRNRGDATRRIAAALKKSAIPKKSVAKR